MQVGEEYFFLEMNTRVQVEHCVTEMVTGIDIVREQIRIAAGEPLSIAQDDVELRGHAIECRINAEAAHKNFAPAPGRSALLPASPSGPGVRVDSGVEAGAEVTPLYDPMVAKLIIWDVDREQATRRMIRALGEYDSERPDDADPLPQGDPRHRAVGEGRDLPRPDRGPGVAQVDRARRRRRARAERRGRRETAAATTRSRSAGKLFDVKVIGEAAAGARRAAAAGGKPPQARAQGRWRRRLRRANARLAAAGHVFKVAVAEGAEVEEGALICVIEAMKMENEITAHKAGKVTSLAVEEGDP